MTCANEELKDLPKEWIELLNSMPDIKEEIIEDRHRYEDEMISPYFFSYFEDDYMKYKPFFSCFKRGEEVFNNFYSLYGDNDSIRDDINEVTLKTLLIKRMEGINNLLKMANKKTYDISNIRFEETTYDILDKEYDLSDIEEIDIKDYCADIMWDEILPDETINPISAFEEALYNLTLDYKIVYYILWPLGKKDDIENPYAAYVKLWENRIETYVINENLVKYVINK